METFPARRSSDRRGGAAPAGLTALIVDDEASYRARIGALARRAGFTADEACDNDGIALLLSRTAYDLLLIDRDIAGIDALGLIARLRAAERSRNVYAIVITSRPDAERDLAALAAGYDDWISKSATEMEVAARLVAARRLALRQQAFDRVASELFGLAARDDLTGVFNRRFFVFEAEKLLQKAEPFAVVLFDLDGFKRINDANGHLIGDRVLRDVGSLFQRCTRPDDLLARYGGDEFVMAISGASLVDVEQIAARLVREIERLRWTVGDRELSVGVTVGLSSSRELTDPILAQLLDAADRDLYRKKGRKGEGPLPFPPVTPEAHA